MPKYPIKVILKDRPSKNTKDETNERYEIAYGRKPRKAKP